MCEAWKFSRKAQGTLLLSAVLSIAFFFSACLRNPMPTNAEAKVASGDSSAECLNAAKGALGPDAEVAKCGHLTGGTTLEVVAFLRLKQFKENKDGIPVSRLVILRRVGATWSLVLDVDKQIKNPSGYVGIDFIDDDQDYYFSGYRALLDVRSDDPSAFALGLSFIKHDGEVDEGLPIDVSWNSAVGRFQEFNINKEPSGFQSETKNPPHIHSRKPKP